MNELIGRILAWLSGALGSSQPAPASDVEPPAPMPPWLSLEQFRKATGLSATKAQDWYPHVAKACVEFGITTPTRIAAFLAQVGHESGGFVYTREIWGPTAAQQRYEGRADLGNWEPGDGSRFRGRGLIQITGRANYQAVSDGLGVDFVGNPALLEQPEYAALSAAWWWANNGCNELADAGDFERLTRQINGGLNGYADRAARWKQAKMYVGGLDA